LATKETYGETPKGKEEDMVKILKFVLQLTYSLKTTRGGTKKEK
jgi:hypothetical protein